MEKCRICRKKERKDMYRFERSVYEGVRALLYFLTRNDDERGRG